MSKNIKNIVDLNLVNIIETELLSEFKIAHDAFFNYKISDDEQSERLLDDLNAVEVKCKQKLDAFNQVISSLLTSYQKSLNQFVAVEAAHESVYAGLPDLVNYKFDLIGDILMSLDDDFDFS